MNSYLCFVSVLVPVMRRRRIKKMNDSWISFVLWCGLFINDASILYDIRKRISYNNRQLAFQCRNYKWQYHKIELLNHMVLLFLASIVTVFVRNKSYDSFVIDTKSKYQTNKYNQKSAKYFPKIIICEVIDGCNETKPIEWCWYAMILEDAILISLLNEFLCLFESVRVNGKRHWTKR